MILALAAKTIATVVIAILVSSFTLILLQSWIKYPLFIIEVIAILAILASINRNDYPLGGLRRTIRYFRNWGRFSDLILTIISVQLVLFTLLDVNLGVWQLTLALITTSFLSGYSIIKIVGMRRYFSALEGFVLSFVLSLSFTAILTLVSLTFIDSNKTAIISSAFLILGLFSLFNSKRKNVSDYGYGEKSLSRSIDLVPIAVTLSFYLILLFILYPSMSFLPGTDVARHVNYALTLYKTPELYTSFSYIFFHAFEVGFYSLAGINQSVTAILSTLAILTLFLPLSVYTLAKRFLSVVDRRIPSISLLLYCFTSGLTFLYYAEIVLTSQTGNNPGYVNVVQQVAEKSFFGIINFVQPVIFFTPLTVSIIILSMLILLLKNFSIPRTPFIMIFTVLILSIYFVHVPEAVIFVLFLGVYGFFSQNKGLRLDDGLVASLIGYSIIVLFLVTTPLSGLKIGQGALSSIVQISPMFIVIGCLLWRWKVLSRLRHDINILHHKRTVQIASNILIVVYLGGIIIWIVIDDINTLPIYELGAVPWFIYPIILGIVGLLVLLSLKQLTSQEIRLDSVNFLLSAIGFSLLIGKTITYVSANFAEVNYWERRFLLYIFLFSSFLAPVPLIRFYDYLSRTRKKLTSNIVILVICCSVILCGFSSMAIQVEYWYITATGDQIMSRSEAEAIDSLKRILHNDKYAFAAAPTSTSQHVLAYAAPVYIMPKSDLLFYSKYPELPLMSLNIENLNHAYIYLHTRDMLALENIPDSWFANYFLEHLPQVFSNKDVKIFNASSANFPQPRSDTALTIPDRENSNSWLNIYEMLYRSGLNYTEYHDSEPKLFAADNIIMPVDPKSHFGFYDNFQTSPRIMDKNWKPISGNWLFTSNGLEGKGNETDTSVEHTIVSPIYSRNGSISSLFKIKNSNPELYSYVSIITSWTDSKNYEFGGIVTRDREVFAYFGDVIGGKVSYEPGFPFLYTNLSWTPNTTYNLTISTKSDSQDLFINGTKYLQRSFSGIEGQVGLSFARTNEVLFLDFQVENKHRTNDEKLRIIQEFVKRGGNLFVVNSEGLGDVFGLLNSSFSSDIRYLNEFSPNGTIKYYDESLDKGGNREADIFDRAVDQDNFYVIEASAGNGSIVYVNILPQLRKGEPLSDLMDGFLQVRPEFFKTSELEKEVLTLREIPAFFTEMRGDGKIEVNSNSILFPPTQQYNLEINQRGQGTKIIRDGTLSLKYVPGNVSLYSDGMRSINGKGLYSHLVFDRGSVIADFHKDSIVEVTDEKNSTLRLDEVSSVKLYSTNPINLYAKQPFFNINGNTSFYGFQGDKYVYSNYGVEERTTKALFEGILNFSVPISDRLSLLDSIAYSGSVDSNKPAYNELSLVYSSKFAFNLYDLPIIVRVILLVPFILAIVLLFYKKIF